MGSRPRAAAALRRRQEPGISNRIYMQRAPHRIIEPLTNHFPDMQSVLLPSARQRDVLGGGVGLPGHPVAPNPEAAPIAPDAAGHLCHPPAVPCSLQPGPGATRKGRRREGGREVGGGTEREREWIAPSRSYVPSASHYMPRIPWPRNQTAHYKGTASKKPWTYFKSARQPHVPW